MKRKLSPHRRLRLYVEITERRRRLKAEAVELKGGKCSRCGFKGVPAAFDFHHPDPSKKDFKISNGSDKSLSKIRQELEKTILLWQLEHRTVHDEQFQQSLNLRKERLTESRKSCPKGGRLPTIAWPSDDEFLARIKTTSKSDIREELGCSENAVWKHLYKIQKIQTACPHSSAGRAVIS
jgi:hypothetical protein